MLDKISDKIDQAKSGFKIQMEQVSNLSNLAKDKISESIENLIGLVPQLESVGFKVTRLALNMGLPPSADFQLDKVADVPKEKLEQLLKQYEDHPLLSIILKAVISADQFQSQIQVGRFQFEGLEVQLGLTPGVRLIFTPQAAEIQGVV